MKFSKKVLSLLFVLICTIALVGCGGGGGSSSSSTSTPPPAVDSGNTATNNPASIYITIQDKSGNALAGVVAHYTDPNGVAKITAPSNEEGKITIVIAPEGKYTIGALDYNGTLYNSGGGISQNYDTSSDSYLGFKLDATSGSTSITDMRSVPR